MAAPERLLRTRELHDAGVPYQRTRIMQLVAAGEFPEPIKMSARLNVWRESEVRQWVAQKAA